MKKISILKFGGNTLANKEKILLAVNLIKQRVEQGILPVVVASANGNMTDILLDNAYSLSKNPNKRELDMLITTGERISVALLSIALNDINLPAVSLTGSQIGLTTTPEHAGADIKCITSDRLQKELDKGHIPIIAGFQGIGENKEITTLKRGGSDVSAVFIASQLGADHVEMIKDVDGVYTADPRIVKKARKIPVISYDELFEMASSGSKVMQARSVEFARKYGVVFEVRSSFNNEPGTIVKLEVPSLESLVVSGVAVDKNQTKVTLSELPDQPGVAAEIFESLGKAGIMVDMIVQNIGRGGKANLTFTVAKDDATKAEQILNEVSGKLGCKVSLTGDIAKVS